MPAPVTDPSGGSCRVLVVDDDDHVREVVRRGLQREGCEVVEAADGLRAIAVAASQPLDVVVLDRDLPGASGLDVLAELVKGGGGPHVILLTAAGREHDRVLGLASGADDYVVKPFSVRELAARVLAAQRRRTEPGPQLIEAGGVRVDVTARQAWVGDVPVELTRRELDLLIHLASHPGRLFSRDELLRRVWGSSAEWQTPATVTEHVRRLRTKTELDPDLPFRIVTVRGAGYRFDTGATSPPPRVATEPAVDGVEQIAHELNNRLAVILNHAEFAREGITAAAERDPQRWDPLLHDVERVGEACQRSAALVQHLVELARAGSRPGPSRRDRVAPGTARPRPGGDDDGSSPRDGPARTILLVDDDEEVRAVTERLLALAGYDVVTAPDAPTAIAVVAAGPGEIDLLLTDVEIPEVPGAELADRILELNPSVRVVFMSGYRSGLLTSRGALPRGAALIQKPFSRDELVDGVRRALGDD